VADPQNTKDAVLDPEATRLRAELADTREQLERLAAEHEELVYVASHDLTEPLRMVRSYLQLLEQRLGEDLDERSREFVRYAVDGADRMGALIDDLLRYSRAGGTELRFADVDAAEVLDGVLRGLGRLADDTGARVVVDGRLPVVAADPVQLGQLLQNLLANAMKFHRPGAAPTVRVGAHRDADDEAWVFTVADDGIGVPHDARERIFRVFQRLHTRDEVPGNGIGLAICRRIVERRGGAIDVVETPGGGATFRFTIPDRAPEDGA
jgi:light-regulated signal transduction histidine kinase (bacteriophytochrome)